MKLQKILLTFILVNISIANAELIVVGTNAVNFGTHSAHEARKTDFIIKNTGKTTVNIIRINRFCSCIATHCPKMQIEPGEEISITVTVLPDSVYGYYSKNVLVETTDPAGRTIFLSVSGTAVPLVNILPSSMIYAGRLPLNKEWVQKFELEASNSGVELGTIEQESNFPVKIDFVKLPVSNSLRWQLVVTLEPPQRPGSWQCKIKIPVRSPEGHPPLVIGITAKIGNELYTVPQIVQVLFSTEPFIRGIRLHTSSGSSVINPNDVKITPSYSGLTFNIKKDPRDGTLVMTASINQEFMKLLFEKGKQNVTVEVPGFAPATITFQPVGSPPSQHR